MPKAIYTVNVTKADIPILNDVGTFRAEKTGAVTKNEAIRQNISRATGKLCSNVSIG
jgi:hypothetical protein